MARDPLSLQNLTMFDFSPERMAAFRAEWDAKEQVYKDKYGDRWQEQMDADFDQRNRTIRRRFINTCIYNTGRLRNFPTDRFLPAEEVEFERRLREVYGDQYDVLIANRVNKDPRVAELLILEAIRTGDWEALPKSLYAEYHARVGGQALAKIDL